MSDERVCKLCCIHNSHEPIILKHNEEIILGRGPDTKIKDMKCSRKQVSVVADVDAMKVQVKRLGPNKSGINGFALKRGSVANLRHGDKVEVLLGRFIHNVEFYPPPFQDEHLTMSVKKRQLNELDVDSSCSKRLCHESDEMEIGGPVVKPCIESKWESIDNEKLLIYTSKDVEGRSKIAAYDMDNTIICTMSGRVFPKDSNDWKIAYTEVPGKLKQLWSSGYKIVILTNQAGISKGKLKSSDLKTKVMKVVTKLGVPVQVFISTGKGLYRKPAMGMWNELVTKKNDGVTVSLVDSLYCGDAAGREANWAPKKKKDFSSSDRLLAINVGVPFYTPEEHFLGWRPAPFKLPDFNPAQLSHLPLCDPSSASVATDQQEVVVMVGAPGSGKSHFVTTYLVPRGYEHINRDTLGSWQRCMSALEQTLARGHSVAVDNTNPDRESRRRFVEAAKKRGLPCRCMVLAVSLDQSRHNNKFRELTDDNHELITDMVINMYKTKYGEPIADEGFDAIIKINFVPKFKDPNLQKLYQMYLMEK